MTNTFGGVPMMGRLPEFEKVPVKGCQESGGLPILA